MPLFAQTFGCGGDSIQPQERSVNNSDPQPERGTAGADIETRYKWVSDQAPGGKPAEGIVVKEVIDGGLRIVFYGSAEGGAGYMPSNGYSVAPAAPGSRDIHVEIDSQAKSTIYAGLTFTQPCVVQIRNDGTVLADKERLTVKDKEGREWESRRVGFGGEEVYAFFPKD